MASRTSRDFSEPMTSTNSPVNEEIEKLNKILAGCAQKLTTSPNEKAARAIIKLSAELSALSEVRLLTDFENSFRVNLEHELWRRSFLRPIEALKQQSANGGDQSGLFQQYMSQLLDKAISFYQTLLNKYERKFGICFEQFFHQLDQQLSSVANMDPILFSTERDNIEPTILRSSQRHFIYLGDLHRYKAKYQEVDALRSKYSLARRCYLQAYFLEPMNGQPLNNLALLYRFDSKWLDVIFHFVRALSVRKPYEQAREPLEVSLNNLRGTATVYEKWIWELNELEQKSNCQELKQHSNANAGPISTISQHKGNKRTQNYREIWTHPNSKIGQQTEKIPVETAARANLVVQLFRAEEEHAHNTQRKAIAHLLHSAGILISTIGIDQFRRTSQLALDELEAFITTPDAILSPSKLLKIIFLFTFPVHFPKKDASAALIQRSSVQKADAIDILLGIFERLLQIVSRDLPQVGLYILSGQLSKKFLRVLPSLCFLLHWFSQMHAKVPALFISLARPNCWSLLAALCNRLHQLREQKELVECSVGGQKTGQTGVLLPEFLMLSPYADVLPKEPSPIFLADSILGKQMQCIGIHARFGLILHFGELLAKDENFPLLKFDSKSTEAPFQATKQPNADVKMAAAATKAGIQGGDVASSSHQPEAHEEEDDRPKDTVTAVSDEHELKKQLLSEEELSSAHRWIIHVVPKYLVPDTNTFIDHLDQIQLLTDSKLFDLLVPTVVIDELSSLTFGVQITGSTLLPRNLLNPAGSQSAFVMEQATAALKWLREMADQRMPHIQSVTSNGNILQRLNFVMESVEEGEKRSNDDRILSVCVNLCKRLAKFSAIHADSSATETHLERKVVLLTEDRGLSVKALAEKIPVRMIPNFTKWALGRK